MIGLRVRPQLPMIGLQLPMIGSQLPMIGLPATHDRAAKPDQLPMIGDQKRSMLMPPRRICGKSCVFSRAATACTRYGLDMASIWPRYGLHLPSIWPRYGLDIKPVPARPPKKRRTSHAYRVVVTKCCVFVRRSWVAHPVWEPDLG